MKHNWEYKRLGDVAPSMPYNGIITPNNGKYWCLNLDKIEPNTGAILKYDFIEESKLNDSVHKFTIGNVLFSKLRPNLNKVIVPDHKGYCTTELVPLLPKSILNKYFLAYYLRSPRFVNFLIGKTGGAKMPRVKMDIFWNSSIPVPPREEQERIVAELDKVNEVIDDCRELLRNLDTLAQSIFYDFFGDPITNPKGWDVSRFGELCKLSAGGDKPLDVQQEESKEYATPIYSNGIENEGLYGYTTKPRITTPSITISGRGTLGIPFIRLKPFVPIIRLIVAIPTPKINLTFLFFLIKFLKLGGKGAAIPQLTVPMVKNLLLPIPPLTLQEKFAERIERIDEQKKAVEQTIAELKTLLDSRMDYWFN